MASLVFQNGSCDNLEQYYMLQNRSCDNHEQYYRLPATTFLN